MIIWSSLNGAIIQVWKSQPEKGEQMTKDFKIITDEAILALNEIRKRRCITDGGECVVVRKFRIACDETGAALLGFADINVFATEAEANNFIAKMELQRSDTTSFEKYTYATYVKQVW